MTQSMSRLFSRTVRIFRRCWTPPPPSPRFRPPVWRFMSIISPFTPNTRSALSITTGIRRLMRRIIWPSPSSLPVRARPTRMPSTACSAPTPLPTPMRPPTATWRNWRNCWMTTWTSRSLMSSSTLWTRKVRWWPDTGTRSPRNTPRRSRAVTGPGPVRRPNPTPT